MLKRYLQFSISLTLILVFIPLGSVLAEPASAKVVINEIQTGGVGTGTTGQEFIELINIGNESADLTGYQLQYTPSTGNVASTKNFVTFRSGTILYHGGYLLIAPSDYLTTTSPIITYDINSSFSGLSGSGATVSLVDNIGILVDRVGYGSSTVILKEGDLASAPSGGKSIERVTVDTTAQDTDNNKNDFSVNDVPTPLTTNVTQLDIDPEVEESTIVPSSEIIDTTVSENIEMESEAVESNIIETVPTSNEQPTTYKPILLNELFIDPDSPLTDANDEWVELYNPSNETAYISGYTLYAGTSYSYHYTFLEGSSIASHGYLSVTSGNAAIALANGGGAAKIVSPVGEIFDQVTYDTSKTGQSWAKDSSGIWQWTTTPSQDSQNIFTTSLNDPIKAAAASLAAAKKPKTTASATSKPKAAAVTKPKAPAKSKSNSSNSDTTAPGLIDAPMPIPAWLLAVFGGLAILYAVYEYRFELSNKFFQFREYRANRRANRPTASWWRINSSGE
jgi:hypothetical protein